jgi:phosphoglycerate kinase
MIKSQLPQWKFHHKKVFLRADLNVPLKNGTILNDFRLQSIVPTLNYLLKNNNMIILVTHIGRPKGYDKNLSTELLIPWFKEHHYNIAFAPTIKNVLSTPFQEKCIVLLENVRFFPEEQDPNPLFAKQLAQTADYYVNDAFGTLHKNDCSITLLPYEFSENRRTIGFLVEKELSVLDTLAHNPQKPFIAILGGKKIKEKIPLIKNLLHTTDTILLCPALCFSFLATLNKPFGKSLIEESTFSLCKNIIIEAQDHHVDIVFPQDYQIAENIVDGTLSYTQASQFPSNAIGISIGPKTVDLFIQKINAAQTIFFNCAMGFAERPETRQSTYALLHAMAKAQGVTVVAGGDTIEAIFTAGVADNIDHLLSGGGAALAYLGGNQLPGLIPFEES